MTDTTASAAPRSGRVGAAMSCRGRRAGVRRRFQSSNAGCGSRAVFDVPGKVSACLERARMEVGELSQVGPERCSASTAMVGEAIEI